MEHKTNLIDELETTQAGTKIKAPTVGVVSVGGQKYAVGLVWQPLQNLDDPIMEIREAAESELGADIYCLRPATTPQYGIGRTEWGHKEGMPSLAASVASALSNRSSVCAVFKIEAGWWLVAIRNDLILAEEDVVFTNEAEAQRAYAAMMAVPDWDLKIVPKEWNITGTEQQDLVKLIQNVRRVRLKELNAVRRTKFLLVIALLILAAVVYVIYLLVGVWKDIFTSGFTRPEIERPQVLAPVRPEPEKPKPWEKVPDMAVFMNQCWYDTYQVRAILFPGWSMGTITCTPKGISTSWRLADEKVGRLPWIKFGIGQYQLMNFNIDIDASGTSATGNMPFTKIPLVPSQPTLSADLIGEDLKEIQKATGLESNIQYSRQTLYDPPNRPDGSRPANQKAYTYYSFTIVSPYFPKVWLDFFKKFSGLELLKLEYTPSGEATNKWKYEGRIYAK